MNLAEADHEWGKGVEGGWGRHKALVLMTLVFSHRTSITFVISKNTDKDCILKHNFQLF